MQEVFEKIIEAIRKNSLFMIKPDGYGEDCISEYTAIEIVKQEAEECKPGHFGCNSNGQHEKCSSCCDYDCNVRNRTWFGEDELDNNGWIPCSERMPGVPEEIDDDECPDFNVTIKGADRVTTLKCASDGTWFDDLGYTYDVIAWQPLPAPYQSKGE